MGVLIILSNNGTRSSIIIQFKNRKLINKVFNLYLVNDLPKKKKKPLFSEGVYLMLERRGEGTRFYIK